MGVNENGNAVDALGAFMLKTMYPSLHTLELRLDYGSASMDAI